MNKPKPRAGFGKIMQVKDGKPYRIKLRKGKVLEYDICCDCGLVHLTGYEPMEGYLRITAWRDEKRTKQQRKRKQVIVVK